MSDVPLRVFVSERFTPLDLNNIRHRAFTKSLEKAGLRTICLHDLRHIYAALLISQGESLAYDRAQMWQRSIQVWISTGIWCRGAPGRR